MRAAHILALLLVAACASHPPPPYVFAADPDAGLPECVVPGDLVPPSTGPTWALGRAVLVCTSGSSGGAFCVSDEATCPSFAGTCTNVCAPNEFAVGGGPFDDAPTPPSGCSLASGTANFGGVTDECCACQ
jgi:hypothetical protein